MPVSDPDPSIRLLELLRAAEGFVSGESLSQLTGTSRAVIWKQVEKLRQQGHQIEGRTRKGYRLLHEADLMTEALLRKRLLSLDDAFLQALVFRRSAPSTNLMAREIHQPPHGDRTLFITEEQTTGRGRRGRSWLSAGKKSLTFSLLLRPQASPSLLPVVPLLVGLAVSQAFDGLLNRRQGQGPPVLLKWPNDLIAAGNQKKIGGILVESILEEQRVDALIIGIGLNLNQTHFTGDLSPVATSIRIEHGIALRRLAVLKAVLSELAFWLPQLTDQAAWLPGYQARCQTLGQPVTVLEEAGSWEGQALAINQDGALLVKRPNGKTVAVHSGQVSIRSQKKEQTSHA